MKIILEQLKKIFYKKKWRKRNPHNQTQFKNIYDFNCVEIGIGTYGPIDVDMSLHNYKLKIGNYCSIGDGVKFVLSSDHPTNNISTFPFRGVTIGGEPYGATSKGDIILEDDVWIGCRAIILSGVHIGQGAIVAAGAVVTSDVPPYAIVGGVPAKVLKYRFENSKIKQLLKVDFSKLTSELILNHIEDLYTKFERDSQIEWLPKKGD